MKRARHILVFPLVAALTLSFAGTVSAVAAIPLYDDFKTLDPTVWHISNSTNPAGPMDHCPGSVTGGCLPGNVTTAKSDLRITVPHTPINSGGQIVSLKTFQHGNFETRLAAGTSRHALNAMFLYSFASQDEIDIEVTYDGVTHDACGTQQASHRWEVWFTVWKGGTCVSHAEFPLHNATAFHDYAIDWRADTLTFSVNGTQTWAAPSSLTTSDMQLIFNSYEPSWKNPSNQATPASHMRVDSVRVGF